MKIAVDAMGGDNAPAEIIKGAVLAAKKYPCEIILVGDEKIIRGYLPETDLPITIRHASEVIQMGEHPADAVRVKKDSSIVVATKMVKDGECDAVLSAGSTGASVAAAQLILRRIQGIGRPAIATPIPTPSGTTLLLDSGANVDSKPEHLIQSGIMGSLYAEHVLKIKNPSVALLNIGEEETKGNEQAKETYQLLKNLKTINFAGNAEGRDIPRGKFDVVICDGFVGNVVLKFGEGLALTIMELLTEELTHNGGIKLLGHELLAATFKNMSKRLDVSENGGAPLLGVNGCCVISHGSSDEKAICSAIGVACDYVNSNILKRICHSLALT
ncbi:MAG: phosphate acyltransferase PlsX [Selenomonadaceae bacterium]|nr:phosphate acyltransferase PlsX [Selenomonadaceae bacterium]